MKFLSFRHEGQTSYGVKVKREEAAWDLKKVFADFAEGEFHPKTLLNGLQQNQVVDFQEQVRKAVVAAEDSGKGDDYKVLFSEIEFLPPVTPTNNVIAFGRNYQDHASELNHEVQRLYVFTKAASSLTGDNSTIPNHKDITDQLDYEGELGIVIGKSGEKIPKGLALDYVYGYTIINDITDRKAQNEQDQAFLSKSLTGGCPIGPYIVTKDELPTPEDVNIVTKVNNEIRQDGNTGQMILKIDELIEEISKFVALHPGDIIATGTPAGVGAGMNPPKFLQPGDEVKVTIDNIGTLTNFIADK
ncbi:MULTISPECIES: fumarylacetoacetate hydrolase family protein [Staphylococcus]|jgi:2-keto-4-pentenoate hydratase/2-oxohepta-3-ene-1,7-dioic acid hydratase in catechol pathway|uniref:FAA hydrolase family protein n=1 Tax=Staphylococcus shinii TaxID=2912228 RepID=A0A418IBT1_9STAP|nr:fumarylacetoacetate hydrolase family protein [Staphylococcus shinii]MBO3066179.1 fumarylacetoacetate hydrolase family protein [Staphylococcus shinii]MDW8564496.1 fumarylacetoacetate hydrolase family protein [Staphylococcus shinii]MDW8567726.1 fumarylacetoacetate hydrolase family protein [Staphylococcus shinii]MDW8570596.1 fumarylacetoacetate hydrolase family protein [Staphylococcus shinii]MDW8573499.1 fumarylacetoacetate hydrolase family protein [Staphylococcus shinii]